MGVLAPICPCPITHSLLLLSIYIAGLLTSKKSYRRSLWTNVRFPSALALLKGFLGGPTSTILSRECLNSGIVYIIVVPTFHLCLHVRRSTCYQRDTLLSPCWNTCILFGPSSSCSLSVISLSPLESQPRTWMGRCSPRSACTRDKLWLSCARTAWPASTFWCRAGRSNDYRRAGFQT